MHCLVYTKRCAGGPLQLHELCPFCLYTSSNLRACCCSYTRSYIFCLVLSLLRTRTTSTSEVSSTSASKPCASVRSQWPGHREFKIGSNQLPPHEWQTWVAQVRTQVLAQTSRGRSTTSARGMRLVKLTPAMRHIVAVSHSANWQLNIDSILKMCDPSRVRYKSSQTAQVKPA
jgi:hypothetical protein